MLLRAATFRVLAGAVSVVAVVPLLVAASPAAAVPTASWSGDEREPLAAVRAAAPAGVVVRNAWVQVPGLDSDRDGRNDRVHVQYHLPRDRERALPTVIEASPYLSGGNPITNHDVDVPLHVPEAAARPAYESSYEDLLLPRGYAYVYAESVGTGSSTGCPTTGGPEETQAMVAVVRWLTGRGSAVDRDGDPVRARWSTGKVGMIGVSYNGTLPNAVASTGVHGLETVVPVSAISSWYDYYRSQGHVRAPGGYQGEDADVLAEYVLTRRQPRTCAPVVRSIARRQDRVTGDVNHFWASRNYRSAADEVEASVLSLHGLDDFNVMSDQTGRWLNVLDSHDVPTMAWWHPYGHGDALVGSDRRWRALLVDWFARWLKGRHNGVLGRPGSVVADGEGDYRSAGQWPAARADKVRLRPHPGGHRSGDLELRRGGGSERLVDDPSQSVEQLADRARSRHRLLYRTPTLTRAVELSGMASVRLRASFSRRASNVSVALVDLGPRRGTVLSEGWIDPQNVAETRREGVALVPGRRYSMKVQLDMALEHRIPAGRRLGLVLAASDHDFTLRPEGGTKVRVALSRTSLRLPVVGGPQALRTAWR